MLQNERPAAQAQLGATGPPLLSAALCLLVFLAHNKQSNNSFHLPHQSGMRLMLPYCQMFSEFSKHNKTLNAGIPPKTTQRRTTRTLSIGWPDDLCFRWLSKMFLLFLFCFFNSSSVVQITEVWTFFFLSKSTKCVLGFPLWCCA